MGYEDPPVGMTLDDGVYYNKYMIGNKIKMSAPLSDGIVEYSDGTNATVDQMAKDVTTFLSWTEHQRISMEGSDRNMKRAVQLSRSNPRCCICLSRPLQHAMRPIINVQNAALVVTIHIYAGGARGAATHSTHGNRQP